MRYLYLTQAGTLERKQNTLVFFNENTKRNVPVQDVDAIYALGEISLNSKLLNFLTKFQIPLYFFNYFGYFSGVYAPRQEAVSGKLLVEQVNHYNNYEKRLAIAKAFIDGTNHNMRKTLMQYNLDTTKFDKYVEKIQESRDVQSLLLTEAEIRTNYFRKFNQIINDGDFKFVKRVRQPPDNYRGFCLTP